MKLLGKNKIVLVFLSMALTSQSALAGNVYFESELKKRNNGEVYTFISQKVSVDQSNQKPIVQFSECKAQADITTKSEVVMNCEPLAEPSGYFLSDLKRQDRKLNVVGLSEKAVMTAVLVAAAVYSGVQVVAICGLGCHGSLAAELYAHGAVIALGSTVPNFIYDWTPTGNLRAANTISGKEDFYVHDMTVKGSVKEFETYKKYLLQSLSKMRSVSWSK